MIYLASPYTHESIHVMHERFCQAAYVASKLMRDHVVYSPIVHGHAIAIRNDMPKDWEFWKKHCIHMLSLADEMWIINLKGMGSSIGVNEELNYCMKNNKPVKIIDSLTLNINPYYYETVISR